MKFPTAFLAACLCASIAQADVPPEPLPESTVVIWAGEGQGSGFFIGNSTIVTAAHVVKGFTTAKVEMSDGSTAIASVIFVDSRADLAFLDVKSLRIEVAKLACRKPVLGENVMVRGTPAGMRFISTWGRIAGEARRVENFWALAVPINVSAAPGNSGGGVWDERGEIIGVLVGIGRSSGSQFISLAVPVLSVCEARDYLGLR